MILHTQFGLVCDFTKLFEINVIYLHILEEILVEPLFKFINTIFDSCRFQIWMCFVYCNNEDKSAYYWFKKMTKLLKCIPHVRKMLKFVLTFFYLFFFWIPVYILHTTDYLEA